jgi:hypothetical protein
LSAAKTTGVISTAAHATANNTLETQATDAFIGISHQPLQNGRVLLKCEVRRYHKHRLSDQLVFWGAAIRLKGLDEIDS